MDLQETLKRYDQLVTTALACSKSYYEDGQSDVDDVGYDQLVDEIRELELLLPENYHNTKSPTVTVGMVLPSDGSLRVEEHPAPMLSLKKAKSWTDVEALEKSIVKSLGHDPRVQYAIERKHDGVALELIYSKYADGSVRLFKALLRGDGLQGECVTDNALMITSIPKTLDDVELGRHESFVVRGELVVSPYNLTVINDYNLENNPKATQYKTPRHAATATIRQLNKATVHERNPTFIAYELVDAIGIYETHLEAMDFLQEIGFRVGEGTTSAYGFQNAIHAAERLWNLCHDSEGKLKEYDYPVDGIVIKVNSLNIQSHMGATAHHPTWAVAYKYADKCVRTTVTGVHYGMSRLGMLVPVLTFEPVTLNNVVVKQATLSNTASLKWQRYHMGSRIDVRLAGMAIPTVSSVWEFLAPELMAQKPPAFEPPTECPFCSLPTEIRGESGYAVCVNTKECSEQIVKRLMYFVGKECMSFAGFGEVMVRNAVEILKITNPNSLLLLTGDGLQSIGLSGRAAFKMTNIIASRTHLVLDNEPWRYLAGLCIPGVSHDVARELISVYSTIAAISLRTADTLAATGIVDAETAAALLEALA